MSANDSAPDGSTTNIAQVRSVPVRACIASLILFAAAMPGCRDEAPPPAPAPLARVGDAVITAEDVTAEALRLRAAGQPVGDAESVLQSLVERRAMLQEAAASEAVNTPVARRERENLLLSQWLQHTLHAEIANESVTDEELRAYYDDKAAGFMRPAMARLAILYRKPSKYGGDSSPEAISAALLDAGRAFLADPAAATREGRIPGFGAIAAESSEDASSRYRGGDIGWLDPARGDYAWPEEVVRAGCALQVGEVSGVISADGGLYLVMKDDEREGRTSPFEEVSATLRRRLLGEKRARVESSFKSNIMARAAVEIDAAQAEELTLPEPPIEQSQPPALVPVPGLGRQP